MWCSRLDFVVLCVWVYVGFSCADRRAKIDQDKFKIQGSSGGTKSSPTHFIYPRTGRLFHADFVRDNEIFKSLERTNFMRRGPLAQTVLKERQRRTQEGNEGVKKYVYVGERRVPVESKKSISAKERDNPINAVLFKVSKVVVKDPVLEKRAKRDIEVEEAEPSSLGDSIPPEMNTNSSKNETDGSEKEEITSETENKVDCDNISSTKNNDTDKTLFVHDSISRDPVDQSPSDETHEVEVDGGGVMKKTVVDDSLKLYPVYRGVKYYYPQTERRLVYSPQLTVHMDVPLVTEAETEEEANSTAGTGAELTTEEEGRSRRPFKKLAFPLLLALKLKTAIMVPLILGLIGLISFKGLWSGLTALAIAAALGLKALVAGGGAKVLVHALPPPPPPAHIHHLPPPAVEYAEYWSRRNDDHHNTYSYSNYRPSSWS